MTHGNGISTLEEKNNELLDMKYFRGVREHLCRGCASPGNVVSPLKNSFFEKNIDTFFNYVQVNYSITG